MKYNLSFLFEILYFQEPIEPNYFIEYIYLIGLLFEMYMLFNLSGFTSRVGALWTIVMGVVKGDDYWNSNDLKASKRILTNVYLMSLQLSKSAFTAAAF